MWNPNQEKAPCSSSACPSAGSERGVLRAVLLAFLALACAPDWALAERDTPLRLGVVFPGVVADKDYNELGYQAVLKARDSLGIPVSFAQRVQPSEAAGAMLKLIADGNTVVWGHGGQFLPSILEICGQCPDTAFITEAELPVETPCKNVHVLGREYHKGFYVLGALAARITRTGLIGYIGGLHQPFSRAQINAAASAIKRYNPKAVLRHVTVGDFNDPMHSRQAAEEFILEGCDVILSGVNMGSFGIIDAVNDAERPVFFTTVYTSKAAFSPRRFLTSDLFDFTDPIREILGRIADGQPGRFVPMPWGEGRARYTLFPVANVPEEVNQEIKALARAIEDGSVQVPYDPDTVPENR
ncbi:BMP family ABC transporter substrate-binding protein [Fundidesulfovibrio terrae]|uniref:BMP family ABC transporter substrate-binding protein n=1 Tax=Fundidesulfovibrio terrae TaxID=2922866 RepID=UPI001FAF20D2|nr:BMP family ABC transporter substrate-binding protein [Fundidesulfovibrio terrae]